MLLISFKYLLVLFIYYLLYIYIVKSFQSFLSSLPSSIKHIDYGFHNVEFRNHFEIQSQSQLSSIKFISEAALFDSEIYIYIVFTYVRTPNSTIRTKKILTIHYVQRLVYMTLLVVQTKS